MKTQLLIVAFFLMFLMVSCKQVFVWTVQDVMGLILIGIILLIAIGLIIHFEIDKLIKKFTHKNKTNKEK